MSLEFTLIALFIINVLCIGLMIYNIGRLLTYTKQEPIPERCKRHEWMHDVRTEKLVCMNCPAIAGEDLEEDNE